MAGKPGGGGGCTANFGYQAREQFYRSLNLQYSTETSFGDQTARLPYRPLEAARVYASAAPAPRRSTEITAE